MIITAVVPAAGGIEDYSFDRVGQQQNFFREGYKYMWYRDTWWSRTARLHCSHMNQNWD